MSYLVFLDTETTGLDPRENQILTIGYVIDQNGSIIKQRTLNLRYEGGPVSQAALDTNGINLVAHNRDAVEASQALSELNRDLSSLGFKNIIAHNASFDKGFLEVAFARAGIVDQAYILRSNWLCTMNLAGWLQLHDVLRTERGRVNLDACLGALGLKDRGSDAHGALDDALLARQAYYRMRMLAGWNR